MLMTMDNRICGRRAEKTTTHDQTGHPVNISTPHPSHIPGGIAPMDLSSLQIHSSWPPV